MHQEPKPNTLTPAFELELDYGRQKVAHAVFGLSKAEWLAIALGLSFWLGFSAWASPTFGSTDIYLFRDAAVNTVHGYGFTTASFEHSTSFRRLLYSSYTPGSLWLFIPFVAVFANLSTAFAAHDWLIALATTLISLSIFLPHVAKPQFRKTLILLSILVLP